MKKEDRQNKILLTSAQSGNDIRKTSIGYKEHLPFTYHHGGQGANNKQIVREHLNTFTMALEIMKTNCVARKKNNFSRSHLSGKKGRLFVYSVACNRQSEMI